VNLPASKCKVSAVRLTKHINGHRLLGERYNGQKHCWKKHGLGVLEHKVLRNVSGLRIEETARKRRKQQKKKNHYSYPAHRMKWVWTHTTHMENNEIFTKNFDHKP
jgi:hypothetical protein